MDSEQRLQRHRRLAARLAKLEDVAVSPLAKGIGGATGQLELDGERVFVKSIPLSALEQGTTANVFGLPLQYQYGVSSAGFGAWRELTAQGMASRWVESGACSSFPLLHHWRVVPRTPADDPAEISRQVSAWGSDAVGRRLLAAQRATSSIQLFLEWFPSSLKAWLQTHPWPGLERALREVTSFMNARGLLHFDAHFDNILTDGEQLYFSDFGQALSSGFELSAQEQAFFQRHRDFDRSYVAWRTGSDARIAALMSGFFAGLRVDKATPFPEAELSEAWKSSG